MAVVLWAFVPFDRAGGELLFNLLADRYERRSMLVTTHLAFSEWVYYTLAQMREGASCGQRFPQQVQRYGKSIMPLQPTLGRSDGCSFLPSSEGLSWLPRP